MNKFSTRSAKKLAECHKDLQLLCEAVLQDMDITILCGYRGKEEQDQAFRDGHSNVEYPRSKHNKKPSLAVDCAPYPVDFNDVSRFIKMCKLFEHHADKLGIDINLGRDFSFKDYPHVELKRNK